MVKPLTLFKSEGSGGVELVPLTWFVVEEDDDERVRVSVIASKINLIDKRK